jgi:hypothetical protein
VRRCRRPAPAGNDTTHIEDIIRHQLRNVSVAAAITATMLISGAAGRPAAGEVPGEGASPLCYPPVDDPTSRQFTELNIPDPGAIIGAPRPKCQNGAPSDCYLPIVDPDARQYVEWGFVEATGAVYGPPRPTCPTPHTVTPQ